MFFNCDSSCCLTPDTSLLCGHVHCTYICVHKCVCLSFCEHLALCFILLCCVWFVALQSCTFCLCHTVFPWHNTVALHVLSSNFTIDLFHSWSGAHATRLLGRFWAQIPRPDQSEPDHLMGLKISLTDFPVVWGVLRVILPSPIGRGSGLPWLENPKY